MTKYKITIEKTEIVTEMSGDRWEIIGEEQQKGEFTDEIKWVNKFGYTPKIEKQVEVETLILSQVVDNLDLEAVIKAINGIE